MDFDKDVPLGMERGQPTIDIRVVWHEPSPAGRVQKPGTRLELVTLEDGKPRLDLQPMFVPELIGKGEVAMSHRQTMHLLAVIAFAIAAVIPAVAQAREGFLDRSFGTDGELEVPAPFEAAGWLREEGDGSLIVSSAGSLGRFTPDGSLDPTFGEEGRLTFPQQIEGREFSELDWDFDGKGRILVFGTATEPYGPSEPPVTAPSGPFVHLIPRTWVVVMRYTPAGRIDPTFGEGKGFVRGDFGATPVPPGTSQQELREFQIPGATALAFRIDSTDRPVLLIGHEASRSPCYGHSGFEWFPYAVVRLTEAGLLDPTFGEGGQWPVERISSYPRPSLALDAAGNIYVGGAEGQNCPSAGLNLTLNQDGLPRGRQAGSGYTRFPGRYFTGLAPDGAILFRDRLVGLGALSRTWPNGRPDRSFGRVRVESPGARVQIDEILVDREGRVLLGCVFTLSPDAEKPRRTFFAVTRLRRDGAADPGFGKRGWIKTRVPTGSSLGQFELDASDRLLAGIGRRSEDGPNRTSFLRYRVDG